MSEDTYNKRDNNISWLSPEDSKYLRKLKKEPDLTDEEENNLFLRYKNTGDIVARNRIITAYRKLIMKEAFRYSGYNRELLPDLMQEGTFGLIKAIDNYRVGESNFSAYARNYLKWFMRRCVYINSSVVRPTLNGSKVGKNFKELSKLNDVTLVGPDKARDNSGRDDYANVTELFTDSRPNPEEELITSDTAAAVKQRIKRFQSEGVVSSRDLKITMSRCCNDYPPTLEQLGNEYGISKERVRQIEEKTLKLIRNKCFTEKEGRMLLSR